MRDITPKQMRLEGKMDSLRDILGNTESDLTYEQRLEVQNELRHTQLEYQRRYGISYLRREEGK